MPDIVRRLPEACGVAGGLLVDSLTGDPRRGHPVAAFGRLAGACERVLWADDRAAGVRHTILTVAVAVVPAVLAGRLTRRRPVPHLALTVAFTWSAVGGTTLHREGTAMAVALRRGDLAAARARLPHLCGRDPAGLGEPELVRATLESVAENTSDAVVAPLLWAAVAGMPGVAAYRAVNTLDAMVGHRSARYERFGWAAARLDDVASLLPARLTALLAVAAAPLAGGRPRQAWRVLRRDGAQHPSPNAGRCEAAFAGALGVTLGGRNVYGSRVEHRPHLGDGPAPQVADLERGLRLARAVTTASAVLAVSATAAREHRRTRRAAGMAGTAGSRP